MQVDDFTDPLRRNLITEDTLAPEKNIYTNTSFPCLVRNGEEIESPAIARTRDEHYAIVARNALRYLTYGGSLFKSHLITYENFKALAIERDEELLTALRKELSYIFYRAFDYLSQDQLDKEAEARLIIFIKNVLAAYPYLDPEQGEIIRLPKKINNEWQLVDFKIDKIDISPQKGIIARWLQDKDRLYAYGLVPQTPGVRPYLILMGSHYPAGRGAWLNWIGNFEFLKSVGEGHNRANIFKWLVDHPHAVLTGHSKGGTMAMILATLFPRLISEANCLNPAPLSFFTINRLKLNLQNASKQKARILIYVNKNDPVFLLGTYFIPDSVIYIVDEEGKVYSRLEAHALYFTGRKSIVITVLNENDIKSLSTLRELFSYMKEFSNFAIYPALNSAFLYTLITRRLDDFYQQHKKIITVTLFLLGIGLIAALGATGVLAPLIAPIVASAGTTFAYAAVAVIATTVTAVTARFLPPAIKFVSDISATLLLLGGTAIGGIAACFVGAFAFGAKLFSRKFGHFPPQLPRENIIEISTNKTPGTDFELAKVFKKNSVEVNENHEESMQENTTQIINFSPARKRLSDMSFLTEIKPELFPEENSEIYSKSPTLRH